METVVCVPLPLPVTGPDLRLLLSGTGLRNLTLAPHMPSNSGCPPSSCKGSRRRAGICRGGPWVCVLEPRQAAAQSAHVMNLIGPSARLNSKYRASRPLSEVFLPGLCSRSSCWAVHVPSPRWSRPWSPVPNSPPPFFSLQPLQLLKITNILILPSA